MEQFSQIETNRFTLRALRREDCAQVVSLLNDLEVTRWLTVVPHPYTAADFDEFLAYLDGCTPLEGLAICEEDTVLGVVGLGDTLGYWLGRGHHGRGVMTEAAGALVAYAFDVLGRDTLESGYFPGNAASSRVLSKLGFQPTGAREPAFCRALGQDTALIKMRLTRADRPQHP